jgi:hypothetical protein
MALQEQNGFPFDVEAARELHATLAQEIAEYHVKPYTKRDRLVLHYDGTVLREITKERALEIAKAHANRVVSAWQGNRQLAAV